MLGSKYFKRLQPPVALQADDDLKWRVSWMLKLLDNEGCQHPLVHESRRAWTVTNSRLAKEASSGNDDAFCELCRRDPRYLGTEFAVLKILAWKLAIVYSNIRATTRDLDEERPPLTPAQIATEKARKGTAALKVKDAREHLAALAVAVKATTGSGKVNYISRAAVYRQLRWFTNRAREARTILNALPHVTARSRRRVAEATGVPVRLIQEMVDRPRLTAAGVARLAVADAFGVSEGRVRGLIAAARQARRER